MTETIKKVKVQEPVKELTLYQKLAKIQKDLKAPKNQFNKFANFNYRSCEDILEGVKPLLGDLVLTLNDEIVQIGDRYYVKATAGLSGEDGLGVFVSAYAREAETKAGMDVAQITGSSSSYARKYALNGLFLIDDTEDADTKDNSTVAKPMQKPVATMPNAQVPVKTYAKTTDAEVKTGGPSLRQIEAVVKISASTDKKLTFSEVKEWTAKQASDYISSKGNGGYYQARKETYEAKENTPESEPLNFD